jgi:hypothetical protein
MAEEGKQDWIYGTALILLVIIVGFSLVLDYGHGVDIRYVSFFIVLLGFGLLAAIVLAVVSLGIDGDGYKPNLIDSSDVRMLAPLPWSRTIAAGVLLLIFLGGGLFAQSSVIPIVNPYDSTTLIAKGSELSLDHNRFTTALRSGVYPGFGEDIAGFLFTSVATIGLLFLFRRIDEDALEDKLLFVISALLACVAWGFLFASAHSMAYGANEPAFVNAWIYGTVSQLTNQLVGAPVSILAHFAHNFLIVASLSIAACVGGLCAAVFLIPKSWLRRGVPVKSRKGQLELYLLVGVAIAVLFAIIAFAIGHFSGNTLSVVNPSCTDFTNIPGPLSCSSDQGCLTAVAQGGPADPNVQLRCNAGICQAKFLTCTAEVNG